ncbi:MAG: hypothetical protein FWD52_00415 [Candidatus Bathyarchaeota archaeon]|nr:hypothetical protein [Candidatus Termiticorpusculum sp.]
MNTNNSDDQTVVLMQKRDVKKIGYFLFIAAVLLSVYLFAFSPIWAYYLYGFFDLFTFFYVFGQWSFVIILLLIGLYASAIHFLKISKNK